MAVVGPLRSGYGQDSRQDKRQGAANRVMGTPVKSPFSSPLMTYGQSSAKPAMGLSGGSAPRNPAPAVNPNQMDPGQVHDYLNSPAPTGWAPKYDKAQRSPLGVITSPTLNLSPEDSMQVARQHEAARGLGGVPLDQAASVFAGRRDAQSIINRSPQEIQQARLANTPQATFSPLAGEAGNFQAMNQATAADKAQKDAAWNTKMEDYKATKNADANGNGIPDRDEAVATKYGNSGINSINDLAAVNAKYNVYMRGYKSDPEAMKSSRPMSFDEFAKANHADYNKRPVYGAEQSAGQQGGSPLLAAIQAGRESHQKARTEQQNSPAAQAVVAQRQNQVALTNLMGQAMNMGYSQDQAAQIARNQMATNQQLANDQTVRNDAIGLEKLRQEAETGRTKLTADAQVQGYNTQAENRLAVGKQEIEGRLAELKAKLQDPANRIQMIQQIHQMNPVVIAQQEGERAKEEFRIANPGATAQQLNEAGSRAFQEAYKMTAPVWNAMQNDPELSGLFSGAPVSPLASASPATPGLVSTPGQSPLTAPQFDTGDIAGTPDVPGAGFNPAPVGTGGQIRRTESTLRKFLGRAPTRQEMEEQIRAEGGGYTLPPNWQPSVPNTFNSDGALDSNWMM